MSQIDAATAQNSQAAHQTSEAAGELMSQVERTRAAVEALRQTLHGA